MVYAEEMRNLIKQLDSYFNFFEKYNLKLSAKIENSSDKKRSLGDMKNGQSYCIYLTSTESVRDVDSIAEEMCQFNHCCSWM